ncbi:MAG: AI-2E family transporter [Deinococcales bacterium]
MAGEAGAPPPEDRSITAIEVVWRNVWVRACSYVALVAFIVYALWRLRGGYAFALQVGVIGFVIAYILNPVVVALERLRIRRPVAVVIVYFLLLNLLVLGSVLVSQVVTEMGRFVNLVPQAIDNLTSISSHVQAWFSGVITNLPDFLSSRLGLPSNQTQLSEQIRQELVKFTTQLAQSLNRLLQHIITGGPSLLLSGATAVISTTFQVVLIFIASAYFLYDYPRFTANFRRFVPVRWRPLYEDLTDKADRAVGGYLRGQLLITLTLGILIWVGLTIIGVPLATAISFLAAIFNLVPYLGPIIGVLPAVLLGLTVSPLTSILAIGVFLLANQLEGHVLSPLILSRSTNLHPVTVLLAIMAGLGLFGLVGALLAVPLVALIKVVLEEYLLTRPAYATVPPPLGESGGDEAPADDA